MNKVISINIGGSIFQVEEDAYDKLNAYLNELKKHFSNKPEGNEIITDIENRIAELLRSKITPLKAAINIDDVNEVTSSMGAPKDFATEEEPSENDTNSQSSEKGPKGNSGPEYQRSRIYRDPDGRIIGGVCSGLGYYFKIDPLWIRLFFVIVSITFLSAIFLGLSPILVYIILWIVIPEAKTTAEKLQMRKEQINIDNIQKSVQTEFGKVKDTVQSKDFQDKATGFARKLADFIRMVVLGVINIIRKVAKGFFIFFGAIAIIIALSSLTGKIVYKNTNYFHVVNALQFFENNSDKLLAQAAFFFGALAAGLLLFTFAHSLSKNKLAQKGRLALTTSTIIICIAACVLGVLVGARATTYFAFGQKVENVIELDSNQHHFYLRNLSGDYNSYSYSGFSWDNITDDTLRLNDVRIVIEASDDLTGKITETKISRGQNAELARLNASSILALSSVKDSVINLPSSFSLLNNQVYRKQELVYTIKIPVGAKFTIDDRMYSNIDINSNNPHVYAHSGSTYTVTKDGIECDDCTKTYGSNNVNTSSYPLNILLNGREFRKVDVSSAIDLKVINGNAFAIKARGTDNLDDIDIDFDGDEVNISDNRRWNFGLMHKKNLEVIVVMPGIDELKISGTVDAFIDGFNENELEIKLSGASTCKTNFDVKRLSINLTGASNIYLDGRIAEFDAKISGASKLHAFGIPVRDITIDVSGASYAEVNCTDRLDADASGASTIKYKGEVKNVVSKNSGASSVEKVD